MKRLTSRTLAFVLAAALLAVSATSTSSACTRTLYIGADGTVITGRNMDWMEDMASDLWVLPAGGKRDGASGPHSLRWTSKYGSVIVSGYDSGTTDGMNEKGLVANVLALAESKYPKIDPGKPYMSISLWAQYVLDNYATVDEAVAALKTQPFNLLTPTMPNGNPPLFHLSLSDPSGDSAVLEYVDGELEIHHGKQYKVMTNSPIYSQQLAINSYWESIGGLKFLPGTNRAADSFARASFLLDAIPKQLDPVYIAGVPNQSYAYQAVAAVLSVQRAVSVPLGITTPGQPNIASTIWRTVSDQKNRVYYFDSATRPNTFWVSMSKLDLKPGAPVRKLTIRHGEVFAGEVAADFRPAELFHFLPGTPP